MDENNRPLQQEEELTEEGFKFVTLPRTQGDMANMDHGNNSLNFDRFMPDEDEPQNMPSGSSEALTGDKNDLKLKTLYFQFNSVRLSNYDRYHLNHSVYQKVNQSGQPILIVGYTCDLGSPEVNQSVALERAKIAKAYLVELGMDASLIEVDSIAPGEDSNMSYGERLESRRVDIFHLAPWHFHDKTRNERLEFCAPFEAL